MESMTIKIQEHRKEISKFNAQTEKDTKQIERLELEINRVKSEKDEVNCNIQDLNRRIENQGPELKRIHESYHKLPKGSMQEYIQCEVSKLKDELLQEKRQIESELGRIKLNINTREEKSQGLCLPATIEQKRKRALILKLQKHIEQSEAARREAIIKLTELRKNN